MIIFKSVTERKKLLGWNRITRWKYPGYLIVSKDAVREWTSTISTSNVFYYYWDTCLPPLSVDISCVNDCLESSSHCCIAALQAREMQVFGCANESANLSDIYVDCSGAQTALRAQFGGFEVFWGWDDLKRIIPSRFQNNKVSYPSQ